MTAIGMRGQGPKRQVQDTSYYLGELRAKINEIGIESKQIGTEIGKLQTDQSESEVLSQHAKKLQAEVAQLQNHFKDVNLAVLKLQEHDDDTVEKIQRRAQQVKTHNDGQRDENNQIFKARKE